MKRRSKAGRQPIKGRRQKAAKPTLRNAPKALARSHPLPVQEETEVVRLTHERDEALQQQTAASEVLRVISTSPGDLQPVFEAILEKAVYICDAKFGNLFRFDGTAYWLAAGAGTPPELAEFQRQHRSGPFRPDPNSQLEHVMRTKQASHIADAAAEASPGRWATLGGARTYVVVPMIKDDALIGVVVIYRQEVRPFTESQIALVQNFASSGCHRHRERAVAQ